MLHTASARTSGRMLNRDEAYKILSTYQKYEWGTQGFGMLRTYIDNEHVTRLQVWDQRLAVPGASLIHDHPWNFRSTVLAGVIYNQRFIRHPVPATVPYYRQRYWERIITPGPNTIDAEDENPEVQSISLLAQPIEMYMVGESYAQDWNELHCTRYAQGTVTCIDRDRTRGIDQASSIWPHHLGRDSWVSARPLLATEEQMDRIISDCLRTWWL
jgi:hypothetical protein